MRATILHIAILAACGKSTEHTPTQSGAGSSATPTATTSGQPRLPSSTPHPQAKLAVTYDGKPLAMATALAWKQRDGSMKLTVSSVPVGCDEATGDRRKLRDGEIAFGVVIGPALEPDGSLVTKLRYTQFGGISQQDSRVIPTTGDATAGTPTTATVDFALEDPATPAHALVAKGTIDAVSCAPPASATPPLPPEMPATLEVAGKVLPIRGARVTHSQWPDLVLTTGGEGCDAPPSYQDSDLELRLTWFAPEKPEVSQVTLDGELIGKQAVDQTFDPKAVTVTPTPIAPGALTLQIDAQVSGYRVKVTGKVTAVACPQ